MKEKNEMIKFGLHADYCPKCDTVRNTTTISTRGTLFKNYEIDVKCCVCNSIITIYENLGYKGNKIK